MSNSLKPYGLQHTRLSCPSLSPGACSNSRPLSRWCHSTVSFSSIPLACSQSFPAWRSFPMSQFFTSNESVLHKWPKYWSFSFGINRSNEYSELISFRIDWFDLLAVQVMLKSLQNQFESINSVDLSLLYGRILTSVHDHWKNCSFDYMDLCQQSYVFVFHMLSRFVIVFLPRNRHLLVSQLKSPSSDFEAKENKICHCFHFRE